MACRATYGRSSEARGNYSDLLARLIEDYSLKKVCEVGALLDVSEEELSKANGDFKKVVLDICSPDFDLPEKYDLVFSKMLGEHVKDGELFHQNVLSVLSDGGLAAHFFPTLYAFPFIINRIIPESVAAWALNLLAPRDAYRYAKLPSYYNWCRGPTRRQFRRFTDIGYEVAEYRGLFGHEGYYARMPAMRAASRAVSEYLARHPVALLTSYAWVVLRNPRRRGGQQNDIQAGNPGPYSSRA